jgi:hypothetical protein
MPDRTVKRRLQDAGDAALASDHGPIFSTVAKLVEALERSIPEGTQNAERKEEDLRLGRELNEVLTSSYHGCMSLLREITQRGDGI